MNNFHKHNKKRICIWIVGIVLLISLAAGINKISGISKVFSKDTPSTKNIYTSENNEKTVSIAPTPSLDTLNQIEDWVRKDEMDGEEFKSYNYALTQYYGIHIAMVDVVLSEIREAKDEIDAENIVSLLDSFSIEFDNTLNYLKENEKIGVIPPRFIITQIENQLEDFKVSNIKENTLYLALSQKLESVNTSDEQKNEILKNMELVLKDKIYTGYSGLLSYYKKLEPKANNDAGAWKFKDGEKYYAYMLRHNTSLDMSPQEVYDLGLQEINKIQAEIEDEFKKLGYKGTLKENMHSLNNDPSFLYPQDKTGEGQILKDYKKIIDNMYAHMGEMFDIIPEAELMVLPIAELSEESAAQAYYYPAMTNENSQSIFYVNVLKPTYKYDMQSIAFHEGMPGHHLQMALQRELLSEKYPEKSSFYIPAYVEGWGLYAERLADEYGMYEDSYSRLGYLRGELLRAVRLVVDTGIHYKKWTREYAIKYMKSFGCIPDEFVETEIDRYIVNPGQACSYKIGQIKIIELRERAREELGDKFNIKDFHNVVLRNGPMPFEIMEEEVQKYMEEVK